MAVEAGGGAGTPTPEGFSDKQWQAIAKQLGVSVDKAKSMVTAYQQENGGSLTDAVAAVALAGTPSPGSGGDGSSSGGSSSGEGSSGGSAVSAAQVRANAVASYNSILTGWGIPITPEARSFVSKAVNSGMNSAAFIQAVRQTKFYAKRFAGIMRKNGTMRMTESQYIAGYEAARDYAATIGRGFSRNTYAAALSQGNSPSEIRDKMAAVDKLKTYGPMYKQFGDYLVTTGQIKKPPTRAELLKFALGEGPKEWNDTYRTVQLATAVEGMGFDVGKPSTGADIGYKGIDKLAREIEVMGQSGDYTGLLATAEKVLGKGEWNDLGISRKDKVALALGTRRAKEVSGKVQDLVNARVAVLTETRANPQFAQGPKGSQMLTGNRPAQASE